MKTMTYTTIDKEKVWGRGPWVNEPDKMQWQDETTGLPCLAVRNEYFGHWCGYVGISEKHPLFEKDYSTPTVSVHGDLTFSDHCRPNETEETGICHVSAPGEPDNVWWFGFDCNHSSDSSPLFCSKYGYNPLYYKSLEYVRRECARLAKQLKELEN